MPSLRFEEFSGISMFYLRCKHNNYNTIVSPQRIMDYAEQAALAHKHEGGSAKYYNSRRLNNVDNDQGSSQDLPLTSNRHFDHQPVNTTVSSVLLPRALSDSGMSKASPAVFASPLTTLFCPYVEFNQEQSYSGSKTCW